MVVETKQGREIVAPTTKPTTTMHHQLKFGLHTAIVTSPRAGHGGSLFAWEVYQTCHHYGIPAILATLDTYRLYPDIGPDLRRVATSSLSPDSEFGRHTHACLRHIVEEAKTEGKFLILDTKAGFHRGDPMFPILSDAGIQDSDSIAALMPIRHGNGPCFGDFEEHGFRFKRGLFRYWGFKSKQWKPLENTPHLYHWTPRFLPNRVLELIMRGPVPPIPTDFMDEIGEFVYMPDATDIPERLGYHLLDASHTIFSRLLNPITDSYPEFDGLPDF